MEEIEKSIVETFVPAIISELLFEEKITENSSIEEVKWEVFSFLDREQLELMNVAIVLAGICFEQITNELYHKIPLNLKSKR